MEHVLTLLNRHRIFVSDKLFRLDRKAG